MKPPECLSDPLLGKHMYVKISGTKYHYVENGPRGQQLILLIHDFSDFWFGWRNQLKHLSSCSWVVALDLKGFGDSDKPFMWQQYKDEVVVQEIREIVDVLQESQRKIVVIGHGLGGHLAWKFVEKYPEIVSKLVCINAPHPKVWLRHVQTNILQNRWLYMCRLPFLPELEMLSNNLEVFDTRFTSMSLGTVQHNHIVKEAYKYSFSRILDWRGPCNYLRNLPLSEVSVPDAEEEKIIIGTSVEVLFVVGNVDNLVCLDLMSQSVDYTHTCVMAIINGARHSPHQEQPQLVNRRILRFLHGPYIEGKESSKTAKTAGDNIGNLYQLPRARKRLLVTCTIPLQSVLDRSSSVLSSLTSTASSLSGVVSYLPATSDFFEKSSLNIL